MLVHLRPRFNAMWPRPRHPQRRPFVDGTLEERRSRTHLLFTHRRPKRITQMANHLVGRHASPFPLTLRPHIGQPTEHLLPVNSIGQSFHPSIFPIRRLNPRRRYGCISHCNINSRSLAYHPHTLKRRAELDFAHNLLIFMPLLPPSEEPPALVLKSSPHIHQGLDGSHENQQR
jgi:hypothetical protein